ncbi:DUF7312 domain-containing protein [Halolamina sediminis]|uniref:DUF7312 domain-containing protein n=1 Tax=Halolamina sediminis TaxID=1480675 RepID=UPI0006B51E72|nr:hypothetical protein [Halolamina sediminis]
MSDARDTDEGEEEWAISLADLEEGEEEGARYEPGPIEPGNPTAEGVGFVVLGAALTLVLLFAGF